MNYLPTYLLFLVCIFVSPLLIAQQDAFGQSAKLQQPAFTQQLNVESWDYLGTNPSGDWVMVSNRGLGKFDFSRVSCFFYTVDPSTLKMKKQFETVKSFRKKYGYKCNSFMSADQSKLFFITFKVEGSRTKFYFVQLNSQTLALEKDPIELGDINEKSTQNNDFIYSTRVRASPDSTKWLLTLQTKDSKSERTMQFFCFDSSTDQLLYQTEYSHPFSYPTVANKHSRHAKLDFHINNTGDLLFYYLTLPTNKTYKAAIKQDKKPTTFSLVQYRRQDQQFKTLQAGFPKNFFVYDAQFFSDQSQNLYLIGAYQSFASDQDLPKKDFELYRFASGLFQLQFGTENEPSSFSSQPFPDQLYQHNTIWKAEDYPANNDPAAIADFRLQKIYERENGHLGLLILAGDPSRVASHRAGNPFYVAYPITKNILLFDIVPNQPKQWVQHWACLTAHFNHLYYSPTLIHTFRNGKDYLAYNHQAPQTATKDTEVHCSIVDFNRQDLADTQITAKTKVMGGLISTGGWFSQKQQSLIFCTRWASRNKLGQFPLTF